MSAFGGHSTLGTSLWEAWCLDEASGNRTGAFASKVMTDINTVGNTTSKRGAYGADFINANTENLLHSPSALGEIDFSCSLWGAVKDKTDTENIFFSIGESANWNIQTMFTLYALTDDFWVYSGRDNSNYSNGSISNVFAANNTWYHMAVTYNATSNAVIMYFNGGNKTTLTLQAGTSGCTANSTRMRIGGHCSDNYTAYPTFLLNGWVDELYLWSKVLTDQEVSDLYAGGSGLFYRSAETFTKTGQTDGVAGVQSSLQFDRTGTVAGSSGLSGAVAIGTAKTGLIECTSEVAARQMDFYDNSWRRPTGNRRETHETVYNRRILYPSAPRNWRNRR